MTITSATNYVTGSRHTFTMTSVDGLGDGEYASTDTYDNTSVMALDASLYGTLKFGANAPQLNELLIIYYVPIASDGTNDHYGGDYNGALQTDAGTPAVVVPGTDFALSGLIQGPTIVLAAAANVSYTVVVPSVAAALGGSMPEKLQLIVYNSAESAADDLASSGNALYLTPTKYDHA